MSVLEYKHKFNEISRFALELIPNKEEKCRRFEEGLWLDFSSSGHCHHLSYYEGTGSSRRQSGEGA